MPALGPPPSRSQADGGVTHDTIMPVEVEGRVRDDGVTPQVEAEVLDVAVPLATVWSSPDAPREVDGPALLDTPDIAAWVHGMDAALRKGLNGRTLTQLLLGEPVHVLEKAEEWVRVAAAWQPSSAHPSGYPGWVRRAHLAPPAGPGPTRAVVTSPRATLTLEAGRRHQVSFGTSLVVAEGASGTADVHVWVPGCHESPHIGTLRRSDVHLTASDAGTAAARADLLRTAGLFLGLGYLWGGTSSWGLDCSGLVHLVLRSHGVVVPRDARDQAQAALPLDLAEAGAGDLFFFARPGEPAHHVGFVSRPDGDGRTPRMLHAPEGGGLVETTPLATHHTDTVVTAGRVLGGPTG
jgi:gamma-D-glutamyl-L-lysine dipeptidyl-peptidase